MQLPTYTRDGKLNVVLVWNSSCQKMQRGGGLHFFWKLYPKKLSGTGIRQYRLICADNEPYGFVLARKPIWRMSITEQLCCEVMRSAEIVLARLLTMSHVDSCPHN